MADTNSSDNDSLYIEDLFEEATVDDRIGSILIGMTSAMYRRAEANVMDAKASWDTAKQVLYLAQIRGEMVDQISDLKILVSEEEVFYKAAVARRDRIGKLGC